MIIFLLWVSLPFGSARKAPVRQQAPIKTTTTSTSKTSTSRTSTSQTSTATKSIISVSDCYHNFTYLSIDGAKCLSALPKINCSSGQLPFAGSSTSCQACHPNSIALYESVGMKGFCTPCDPYSVKPLYDGLRCSFLNQTGVTLQGRPSKGVIAPCINTEQVNLWAGNISDLYFWNYVSERTDQSSGEFKNHLEWSNDPRYACKVCSILPSFLGFAPDNSGCSLDTVIAYVASSFPYFSWSDIANWATLTDVVAEVSNLGMHPDYKKPVEQLKPYCYNEYFYWQGFNIGCLFYTSRVCLPDPTASSCHDLLKNATISYGFFISTFGQFVRALGTYNSSRHVDNVRSAVFASLISPNRTFTGASNTWQYVFGDRAGYFSTVFLIHKYLEFAPTSLRNGVLEWVYMSYLPIQSFNASKISDYQTPSMNINWYLSKNAELFKPPTTSLKRQLILANDYASYLTQATSVCVFSQLNLLGACLGFAQGIMSSGYFTNHVQETHTIYETIFQQNQYLDIFNRCAKWKYQNGVSGALNTDDSCRNYAQSRTSSDTFSIALVYFVFPNATLFPQY
jgi:hypothetical protein